MEPDLNADAIRRVAFVTRRFHDLRGLVPAVFGAGLILAAFVEQAGGAPARWPLWTVQPLIFANVVMTFAFIALDRGDRRTFGDPVATKWRRGAAGMLCFVVLAGGLADTFLPRPVSVMACGLTAYAAWILMRDWPWRMHYLAAVAGGVAAAVVSAADPSSSEPLRVYSVIGLAIVVTGLGDHRLLAASMAGRVSDAAATFRRGRRLERAAIAILLAGAGTMLVVWEPRSADVLARLLLMALLVAIQIVATVPVAIRGIREFSRDGRVTEPAGANVNVAGHQFVLLLAAAFSAAIEIAFGIRGLLAFTMAAVFAGTAVSARPVRIHHLAIGLSLALAGVLGRGAEPVQAFGMLLCAAGLAVLLSSFTRHPSEIADVHTI